MCFSCLLLDKMSLPPAKELAKNVAESPVTMEHVDSDLLDKIVGKLKDKSLEEVIKYTNDFIEEYELLSEKSDYIKHLRNT